MRAKSEKNRDKAQKILIAEDYPINRELLREMLETLGYQVIEAVDGQQAVEKIKAGEASLAMIDIQMPRLNGLQVLQQIRALPEFSALPMVSVTAYAIRGDRERFLEAGFDGYIAKPFGLRVLKEELERLLK